jgi:predicted ATPase/DNA-binding SARP family transcriptional activator
MSAAPVAPSDTVRWRILRSPVARTAAGTVELAARPQAVLLRLLLDPNQIVTTDRLAEFLWGESPPRSARNSIARFVADIRKALGPDAGRIATVARGYRVEVRPGELDWERAQDLVAWARGLGGTDDEHASALLADAREIAGTSPNPRLIDLPGAVAHVRVHDEFRIDLLERFAEVELRRGRHRELVPTLEQAVVEHPYHERLWGQLILALHRAGRSTDAIRAGRRLEVELAEIGMAPSATIRQLESEILTGRRAELTEAVGARSPVATATPARGLPDPRTPLVGRAEELDALDRLVAAAPLVTVVGLGGSGKTRLALAAAHGRELDGRPVHRVALRDVHDDELVAPAIAAAIGIPGSAAVTDPATLARALAPYAVHLLLDNCEQVAAGCRDVVAALRADAPEVRVLLTSRVPIDAPEEAVFHLRPLRLPAPGERSEAAPAVAMFLDRARDHLAAGSQNPGLLDQVGDVCRRLGGLPLAIELAASQLRGRTVDDLLQAVHDPEGDTLDPVGSASAAVATAISWSWELLPARQRLLLARLTVFRGGWTLDAADIVCTDRGSVHADLADLVATSLVERSQTPSGVRYQLLEPVHDFASDRLGDLGELEARSDRLVDWVRSLTARWNEAELQAWAEPSVALVDELAKLEHLRDTHRAAELVELAIRSCGVWINHGHPDRVARWLAPMADDPFLSDAARSGIAAMVMQAAHAQGDLTSLASWGSRSLDLADGAPLDWVPAVAGFLSVWSRVYAVSRSLDELREIASEAADASASRTVNHALVAMYRGHVEFGQREYEAAVTSFRTAQSLNREPGRLLLLSEVGEALALHMAGRRQEAADAVRSWRSRADTDQWHYIVHVVRAVIMGAAGDPDVATAELAAAVRRLPPATVWGQADDFQTAFALLAANRGEQQLSARLLATPITRYLLLATVVVEHVAAERGRTDDAGLLTVALELWTRHFPDGVRGQDISSAEELVDWWVTGSPDR